VRGGVGEGLLVVLGGDVGEARGEGRELREGDEPTVEPGAGAAAGALAAHHAPHDQLVVPVDAGLLEAARRTGSSPGVKRAVTSAWAAPVRTMSPAEARAPNTSPRASIRMLLPAPVSPVTMLSPIPNDTSTSSMMARSRTCSARSISCGAHRVRPPGPAVNARARCGCHTLSAPELDPPERGVTVPPRRCNGALRGVTPPRGLRDQRHTQYLAMHPASSAGPSGPPASPPRRSEACSHPGRGRV
jgi:hypothetical protein